VVGGTSWRSHRSGCAPFPCWNRFWRPKAVGGWCAVSTRGQRRWCRRASGEQLARADRAGSTLLAVPWLIAAGGPESASTTRTGLGALKAPLRGLRTFSVEVEGVVADPTCSL